MTYNLCLKLAKIGKLTADKLDVFYAADRLTEAEYMELLSMINKEA